MSLSRTATRIIDDFRSRPTLRSGSLIVTVYGDSIAPRGGPVWVGSLIEALDGFGINERLVRTSVYRLAEDGWLASSAVGRKSYYGLTRSASSELERASEQIYGAGKPEWDGRWCFAVIAALDGERRESVRRELAALGFGQASTNLLAHPAPDRGQLTVALARIGVRDEVILLDGNTAGPAQDRQLARLAEKNWNLDDIGGRYQGFVEQFRPALRAATRSRRPPADAAFRIRTLLIHEYRKIVLRDPRLPDGLLPEGWPGQAAYRLCRNLYRELYRAAEDYVDATLTTAEGPIPPPGSGFYARFGGI